MSFLIFIGLGLGTITWGVKATDEVAQLAGAIIGAILLVWGLSITPQIYLLAAEIITVIAVFRICVRCCECD
ncbi:MAG: hypothetical protein ACRC06_13765 [Waterburya sp.]